MKVIFTSVFCLVFTVGLLAQQPQYYNYQNVGSSSNTFPFGQSAGKAVNWLFLGGDFNQPTPAPAGFITDVYFFVTTGGTRTYTNLHILMAQDTISTLTSGQFYPGPWDTVLVDTATLTGPTNGWMGPITLDKPFLYNPAKSLLLFVGQCAASSGTGIYIRQNTLPNIRRVWSVGGCPFTPYSGGDGAVVNFGFNLTPLAPPNLLWYKFEDNPSPTMVWNCASNGVGTNPAALGAGTPLASGGQFDTCISGTGLATGGITTGWNWNTGTSSWTISLWMEIPTSTSGSAYYFFGDAGVTSFRCFHNGVAGSNNLLLRGPIPDLLVTGIGPSPTVVTFVYDSAASQVRAYKNGVFAAQVTATLNMTTGTGFKVGGYGASPSFFGKIDEFRLYRRALSPAEIQAVYNMDMAGCFITGISSNNSGIPKVYKLEQNYPNPFNPTTVINYQLPVNAFVTLKVFDVLGREVAELVNGEKKAGKYEATFDASNLSSGVYFYTLKAGDFSDTKKMLLVK